MLRFKMLLRRFALVVARGLPAVAAVVGATLAIRVWANELTLDTVVLRPMVEADAPARQTGVLDHIDVDEGALFSAGDVLATLDDRTARLALGQAELERDLIAARAKNRLSLQYADKALEVARAELRRSQESIAQFPKSVSQSQIDVERLTVEKLQLERKQAEHDLQLLQLELRVKENAVEAAQLQMQLHRIRAPFDGAVAMVHGRLGEWVEPGTTVMRLIAIDRLRAEGFAPADRIASDDVGRRVRFIVSGDGADDTAANNVAAEGVLRFVSPEMDPVSRQVRIWAEVDNTAHRLRPGAQGRMVVAPPSADSERAAADRQSP